MRARRIGDDTFGDGARFHHVGVAVPSIREVDGECEIIENRTQRVRMAFIDLAGVTVELLEPLGEDSPVSRSVEEGIKLVHLCFEVDDIDEAVASCKPAGFHRVAAVVRVPEYGDRRLAWVFNNDLGLVELLERPPT